MSYWKIYFGEEEIDEVFDTYDEAKEHADYLAGCIRDGAETLHLSNPGDYDDDYDSDYEIVEVDD